MGGEASRTCGLCGVQLSESKMVEHLKTCQKFQATVTRPDGFKLSFEYKGPSSECVSNLADKAIDYRDEQIRTLH